MDRIACTYLYTRYYDAPRIHHNIIYYTRVSIATGDLSPLLLYTIRACVSVSDTRTTVQTRSAYFGNRYNAAAVAVVLFSRLFSYYVSACTCEIA